MFCQIFLFLLNYSILLLLESKQCPLTLASVLAYADSAIFGSEARVDLNLHNFTRFLERDLIGIIMTKSHLVCCRGNLEFILNSKIRNKYAETVPLQTILKQSRNNS